MPSALAELYQKPEIVGHRALCDVEIQQMGGVDGALDRVQPLGSLATGAAILEFVGGIKEHDWDNTRGRAATLLGCLPAKVLLHNFGEGTMAWTLANSTGWRAAELATELDAEGYNRQRLRLANELSRELTYQSNQPPSGQELLTQNAVMAAVWGPKRSNIDLPRLLVESVRPGFVLSEHRLPDFALMPLQIPVDDDTHFTERPETQGCLSDLKKSLAVQPSKSGKEPGLYYDPWLDTPVGIALTYKGIPQALMGLVANGSNQLVIRQLQRVQGKRYINAKNEAGKDIIKIVGQKLPRGIVQVDWHKILIRSAAQLAESLGMETVGLASAKTVRSQTYHGHLSCHLSRRQAVLAYDMTAQDLGFARINTDDWQASTHDIVVGNFDESLADQVIHRPKPVTVMPIESWSSQEQSFRDISHNISTINGEFMILGKHEGPISACVDVARDKGSVRVLDAGCGLGLSLLDLKDQIMLQAHVDNYEVKAVGIDGRSHAGHIDTLRDEELHRLARGDVKTRLDHLAHAIIEPSYYDVAYSYETLIYNDDPTAIIDNVLSALRPGGVYYCNTLQEQSETIEPLLHRLRSGGWTIQSEIVTKKFWDDTEPSTRVFSKFTKPTAATAR